MLKLGSYMFVDLHLHSTASDGTLSPQQLVQLASKLNLRAIAVTDHDSVEGVTPARRAGTKTGVEVVPAVELSSDLDGRDIHFLGYFVDYKNKWLEEHLEKLRQARYKRALKMVEKLKEIGLEIPFQEVIEIAGKGAVGRSHVATVMFQKGYIHNIQEAFDRYIGRDSTCYVEKYNYSCQDVINIIKKIRGIPVLAHPGLSQVDSYIPEFIEYGLVGLEVYHSEHTPEQTEHYRQLAKRYELITTGGSDCHGLESTRGLTIGSVKVPYIVVTDLKELKKKIT